MTKRNFAFSSFVLKNILPNSVLLIKQQQENLRSDFDWLRWPDVEITSFNTCSSTQLF